jgi:hypothetical protein
MNMSQTTDNQQVLWFDPPWWRAPRWYHVLYVVIILSPLIGLVLLVWSPRYSATVPPFDWLQILLFLMAAIAAFTFGKLPRIVRGIRHPFCIHCGYDLSGLADAQHCPECGVAYSLADIDAYRRDPVKFRREWKRRCKTQAASPREGG